MMRAAESIHATRRDVLKATGTAALVLGISLPVRAGPLAGPAPKFSPNAWLTLDEEGRATLTLPNIEMGQGAQTGLAMIFAEEMDLPLSAIAILQADADRPRFGEQATGGSSSIRDGWTPMREAAAGARAMLVTAAARLWGVAPASCTTLDGAVHHAASGRSAPYGALVATAAHLPVPKHVSPKNPKDFRLIGKVSVPRIEGPAKVTGRAMFGIDEHIEGRLVATLAAAPVFGARLGVVDDSAARSLPGVRRILRLDDGVAVVADDFAAAKAGLEALKITWDEGDRGNLSTDTILAAIAGAASAPGAVARRDGDVTGVKGEWIEATYTQPFLAHATMEPVNATVHIHRDGEAIRGCAIWAGTQIATQAQDEVAARLGLTSEQVVLHSYLIGGGYGRRLEADFIHRAVEIARHVDAPVQVIYSRPEDMQHDMYRPAYVDRIAAVLGADGKPTAWKHAIAGSSVSARAFPEDFKDGVDNDAVECAANGLYAAPDMLVEFCRSESAVPTSWWRGVGPTRSLFVVESFVDELARRLGRDPVAWRRGLIADKRALGVLEAVAEKAGWAKPLPQGWGRGVAVSRAFGSYTAAVAEVSKEADGSLRLRRLVGAIDCGIALNPDLVRAQIEGGMIFGASAALYSGITIEKGRVAETDFVSYPMLTMANAPEVEAHVLPSGEAPGGVGEPGTAIVAPAIANAVADATGQRLRSLPLARSMAIWQG